MSRRVFKQRRRYVLISDIQKFGGNAVEKAVKDSFTRLYGLNGLASSGLRRIHSGRMHVFSCSHEWLPKLVLAVSLTREIEGQKAVLKTIRVSGTVRAVTRKR